MTTVERAALPPEASGFSLPEEPLVTIRASRSWVPLDLREIWAFRELLYFLAWRDVKVRYKQAALGVAWAVIQPVFTMVVFTLFFGKLAKVPSEGLPYAIFSYTALLPWTFFSNAVSASGNSLVASAHLITRVYFPRLLVPGAAVLAGMVDFGIASLVLVGLFFWYGVALSWQIVLFPALVLLTVALALGVGLWAAAINVKYRDVRHALPFMMQLWMFISPVIYPTSLMPERWRWLLMINPLTGLIEGYRSALLGKPFLWGALAYSAAFGVASLIYAAYSFRRLERQFADIV